MAFEAGPTSTSLAVTSFGIHGSISADDAVELWPEAAASRLTALKQRRADLHAAMPPFEDIHELAETKMRHANRIRQLLAPKSEGGFGLPELAPQVVAERRQLERVEAELTQLQSLKEVRTGRWNVAAQLERSITDWLLRGGHSRRLQHRAG